MVCMSNVSAAEWLALVGTIHVPALDDAELSVRELSVAFAQLARLRGELAVAQAQLLARRSAAAGRDTLASVSRELGLSGGEAREVLAASDVLAAHPAAAQALASGSIQTGHLAAVKRVDGVEEQAALLALASSQPVDDFRKTVMQFRINQAGPSWRKRQQAARSLTFFDADNGCLGLRAMLPTLQGELVRARLVGIVDAAYRREHPERADVAGGHGVDSIDQRLADALVALAGGSIADDSREDGSDDSIGGTADVDGSARAGGRPGTSGRSGGSGPAPSARAAVVVLVDPGRRQAEVLGRGPVAFDDAVELAVDEARAEVYGIMQDTNGAILKFGRNRRFASALQRLAIAVRDRTCVVEGCGRSAVNCDAHHEPPFEDGGRTDVDMMEARCSLHHSHRHETGETGPLRSASHGPPLARSPDEDTQVAA